MTYCEHHREALRRSNVPIWVAEYTLIKAAQQFLWFGEEFRPPDTDRRLRDSRVWVKDIARQVMLDGPRGVR